jgi:hypothetical protein
MNNNQGNTINLDEELEYEKKFCTNYCIYFLENNKNKNEMKKGTHRRSSYSRPLPLLPPQQQLPSSFKTELR